MVNNLPVGAWDLYSRPATLAGTGLQDPNVRKLPLLWQIPHSHLVDSGA